MGILESDPPYHDNPFMIGMDIGEYVGRSPDWMIRCRFGYTEKYKSWLTVDTICRLELERREALETR